MGGIINNYSSPVESSWLTAKGVPLENMAGSEVAVSVSIIKNIMAASSWLIYYKIV